MTKKPAYRWKFLRLVDGKIKSNSGNHTWEISKWYTATGELSLCNNGFHCSDKISEAFSYVQGEILAKVEVRGKSIEKDDKSVHAEMKIIKAHEWTKTDSVEIAIQSAELVIDIFEKKFPQDDRPRKAIKAAKNYLKNPNDKTAKAAWEAARAAVWAAEAEAAAAWAARAALRAAEADKKLIPKIEKLFDKQFKKLKQVNNL